jgi:hypothetical protein
LPSKGDYECHVINKHIDDAIRFVSQKSKEKTLDNGKEDEKESSKPDYSEDEQLEEEQEDGSDQITTATTTNEVF